MLLAITLFVFSLTVSICLFIDSNIIFGSVLVSSEFSSFEFKEFSIVLVKLLYISVWFIIIADTGLNKINESQWYYYRK